MAENAAQSVQQTTAAPAAAFSAKLQCRMYEQKFPEVDDLVMVQVKQIAEMGAYVNLLEYNNIEGMILLSELSRRRIRSVQKLIRVGRNEVVVVMRVDKEKGYIDLSKRRVSPEEVLKCEEKYQKSRAVHSTLRYIAEKNHLNLEDIYTKVGWPLYKKYGHAYDAFKLAMHDQEAVFEGIFDLNTSEDVLLKKEIMSAIQKKMAPQVVKIRADIEVTCFSYDGVVGIKEALKAGQNISQEAGSENTEQREKVDIKIKLVAPPLFVLFCNTMDKVHGISLLERAIAEIDTTITNKFKGKCVVKMKPRVVSENEDMELAALMERLDAENQEISGDEDSDEYDSDDSEDDQE
ncbi:hypothetical protein MIR68_005353 [Amoeboaphelidium protococcarum]|nr:hypothetical protein MIR68_005353 [Amoeboaphelidium protococcarum]KAI3650324.1 hypothetical protein MP228_003805 [Amoeboaphelidium protococcarum]